MEAEGWGSVAMGRWGKAAQCGGDRHSWACPQQNHASLGAGVGRKGKNTIVIHVGSHVCRLG